MRQFCESEISHKSVSRKNVKFANQSCNISRKNISKIFHIFGINLYLVKFDKGCLIYDKMLLKNLYFFIQARPKEYEKRDKKYGRIEIRKIIVGGGAQTGWILMVTQISF